MEQKKLIELLGEMSLEEKVNQLFQGHGSFYKGSGLLTGPSREQGYTEKSIQEAGSVLSISGAAKLKEIQKNHMEKHPHHIPLLFMADIINGYHTIFPIPLAQGAAFHPEIAKIGAEVAARESAAAGLHITFSPMVDLVRDARWGRVMESTGEDVFLNCEYAKALVEGYQGINPKDPGKIGACIKHFAAYGAPAGGRDYNNVELSERTLRDNYLPAYEAAIKAGALLVMTSFNTLNRIPSSANQWLMKKVLRDEMGFEGVLISDWGAIEEISRHDIAQDKREAAKLALEAGVDIDMMTTCYTDFLKELVEAGEIEVALLNEAVLRVLELKNKLGLFENPYKDADEEAEKNLLLCKEHRDKAREAAEETFVLLENDGILPLGRDEKVAFIGPYGAEKNMLGVWSLFGKEEDSVSIKEAVEAKGIRTVFEKGCDIINPGERMTGFVDRIYENNISLEEAAEMLKRAVEAAKHADKVILCIGEHMAQTGEGASRADITIPDIQKKLLSEVFDVNKNIAVVLFNGRPLDIREIKELSKAILVVWMPGTEGGSAIANILYGEKSPCGKLPMSFPYSVGQVPIHYDEFRTGRFYDGSNKADRFVSRYMDIPNTPLYPFGYGLTYTTFIYSKVVLSSNKLIKGKKISASVKVKNSGNMEAAEVIQMYIRDDKGSVVRPVRELKGFRKLVLKPGEEKEVFFWVTEEMLRFHNINMDYITEEGTFTIYLGGDSTTENSATLTYDFIL